MPSALELLPQVIRNYCGATLSFFWNCGGHQNTHHSRFISSQIKCLAKRVRRSDRPAIRGSGRLTAPSVNGAAHVLKIFKADETDHPQTNPVQNYRWANGNPRVDGH